MKVSKIALCIAFAMMAVGQSAWGMEEEPVEYMWTLYSVDMKGSPDTLYLFKRDTAYRPLVSKVTPESAIGILGHDVLIGDVYSKIPGILKNIKGPFVGKDIRLYLSEMSSGFKMPEHLPENITTFKFSDLVNAEIDETNRYFAGVIIGENKYNIDRGFWDVFINSDPWMEAKGQVPQPQPIPTPEPIPPQPEKKGDWSVLQRDEEVRFLSKTNYQGWIPYSSENVAFGARFAGFDCLIGCSKQENINCFYEILEKAHFKKNQIDEWMTNASISKATSEEGRDFELYVTQMELPEELKKSSHVRLINRANLKKVEVETKGIDIKITVANGSTYFVKPLFWEALKKSVIMQDSTILEEIIEEQPEDPIAAALDELAKAFGKLARHL